MFSSVNFNRKFCLHWRYLEKVKNKIWIKDMQQKHAELISPKNANLQLPQTFILSLLRVGHFIKFRFLIKLKVVSYTIPLLF